MKNAGPRGLDLIVRAHTQKKSLWLRMECVLLSSFFSI